MDYGVELPEGVSETEPAGFVLKIEGKKRGREGKNLVSTNRREIWKVKSVQNNKFEELNKLLEKQHEGKQVAWRAQQYYSYTS